MWCVVARRTATVVRMPPELWEALKAEAANIHMSANSLMLTFIEQGMDARKREHSSFAGIAEEWFN